MTDAFRKKFLDEHNRLRSLVANGRAKDKDGSYVPKAANMLKLKYDCSLERLAAEHVNQCKLAPSKASGARAALGESLIRSTGRTLADQADVMGASPRLGVREDPILIFVSENIERSALEGRIEMNTRYRSINKINSQCKQHVWFIPTVFALSKANCPAILDPDRFYQKRHQTTGLWFLDLEKNGMGRNLTFGAQPDVYKIGHYTQIVWATTRAIGCAVKECEGSTMAVCNYRPTGNILGMMVYKEGEPCSKCPKGARCENGLCVVR
ncbi:unnamed protein product [Nippostrongylus brasiliensis]|uniref:SCP domain-containing protein n=1 Tax=Nippostrongylus brasiliensis TaxID=27835 RepID=A0A0N4YN85_NIPBR|nr:unnamed protein product [Nippostrongylus brasiliensis]